MFGKYLIKKNKSVSKIQIILSFYLKVNIIILFISVFEVSSNSSKAVAQVIEDKYDLNFSQITECSRSWLSWGYNCDFKNDSLNTSGNKPSFKVFYKNSGKDKTMRFNLSKVIILPKVCLKGACMFSVISKDNIKKAIYFKITSLNKNEKEIEKKIIKINSNIWKENHIKLQTLGIKAIRINIYYEGDSTNNQVFFIDRILIRAFNNNTQRKKPLYNRSYSGIKFSKQKLRLKYLTPLTFDNDSTLLKDIKILKQKRIIGIGECSHGSSSIKKASYQFIKNLIINNNCKLVLLEVPIDMTLSWNLYIQSRIPKDFSKQIVESIKCSFNDSLLLMEFLDWLRDYNNNLASKVFIYGIDNPLDKKLYFFDYNIELFGKLKGQYYLKKIAQEKYSDILSTIQKDTALCNRLTEQELKFYASFLKNELIAQPRLGYYYENRDLNMSKRVDYIRDICLRSNEKTVVFAHSNHLKTMNYYDGYKRVEVPLGSYLKSNYGNQYFSISFQVGQGTLTQDECSIYGKVFVDSLKSVPLYSYESAALSTKLPYFYYPSNHLNSGILAYADVGRASRHEDLFKFSSLKRHFDAYIFIRESMPLINVEAFPSLYALDYFYLKRKKMDSIVMELK